MKIKSASRLSDVAQSLFVQLRFHNLSGGIFDERGAAIFAVDWNERALRCADSDRENFHACIGGGLRQLDRVAAEFFAVGENYQRAISSRAFPKCLHREIDRLGNICAAFWNRH